MADTHDNRQADLRSSRGGELAQSRRAVYQEVCKTHAGIATFRAALLGLLPLASGAGVFLLLDSKKPGDALLTSVGVFGFAVTLGLFMYELRGIQDCTRLRLQGENLEKKLGIDEDESQFRGWPPRGELGGLADEVGAGWIVYLAVLASWLYVAGWGANLDAKLGWGGWPWVLVVVYFGVLVLALVKGWGRSGARRDGPATGVHHVGVPVQSLEESLDWYKRMFGLEPVARDTVSGGNLAQMVELENPKFENAFLDFGNTLVELIEYDSPVGTAFQLRNCDVGAIHVCFLVDAIRATYQELGEKGANFTAYPELSQHGPWRGHWWCYFRDLDGIQLELWQRPKRSS